MDEDLNDILNKLVDYCAKHDYPMVALVQVDDDRKLAKLTGQASIQCVANITPDVENIAEIIAMAADEVLEDEDDMNINLMN